MRLSLEIQDDGTAYFNDMESKMTNTIVVLNREQSQILKKKAQKTVPVQTGRLRSSIRVVTKANATKSSVIAGGTRAPYGGYVEDRTQFMKRALDLTQAQRDRATSKVVDQKLLRS